MILKSKLYIKRSEYKKFPSKLKAKIDKRFKTTLTNLNLCTARVRNLKCSKRDLGDKQVCNDCEQTQVNINLIKKNKKFVVLPRGDKKLINSLFKNFNILDKTSFPKLKLKFKFLYNKLSDSKKTNAQKKAITKWINKFGYGCIQAPARSGKCCYKDTLIFTDKGILPIQYIYEKTVVSFNTLTAKNIQPISKTFKKKTNNLIKITTTKGFELIGTPEHPILILDFNTNNYRWKSLENLTYLDTVCIIRKSLWSKTNLNLNLKSNFFLDLFNTSREYSEKDYSKINNNIARLLGYIIGNNVKCIDSELILSITSVDIQEEIRLILNKTFGLYSYFKNDISYFKNENVIDVLDKLGIDFKNKKVPIAILRSTKNTMIAFLSAYFASIKLKFLKNNLCLIIPDKTLAKQIHLILLNFGILAELDLSIRDNFIKILSKDITYFLNLFLIKTETKTQEIKKRIKIGLFSNIRRLLNKFKSKYYYDKIKFIEPIKEECYVYDLTVDKYHNFNANGFIAHNTVMATMVATKLSTKTAIFAHQKELLDQFYETFINFTNIKELEKKENKTLIKINPKMAEIDDLIVCLFTYQKFISKAGKIRLKKIRNSFGLVTIDESHRASSKEFSNVINNINSRYRLALSATPNRKDGLHFKGDLILGPTTVKALTEQLSCTYNIVKTTYNPGNFSLWTSFISRLTKDEKRNQLIALFTVKDLKRGHKIILPVDRVAHIKILADLIEDFGKGKYKVGQLNGQLLKDKRQTLINKAKNGEIDVLIATRKLVSLGLNVPPFSALYEILPIANKENAYQEISRIRTPYKGKKDPFIRLFVDDCGASIACFKIIKALLDELNFKVVEE